MNQHKIAGDLGDDVMESAFVHAIESPSCIGTVLLLDPAVTPMRRVWCVLENYVTTTRARGKRYDLCAIIPKGIQFKGKIEIDSGPALLMDMSNGLTRELCEPDGGIFPFGVSEVGAALDVACAEASQKADRRCILNILAGKSDLSGEPPAQCNGYQAVNKSIRARYRGSAMYIATWRKRPEQLQKLLADGVQGINEQSSTGATPLYVAAERGSIQCLRILLEARAVVDLATNKGKTPAFIAKQREMADCLQLLLEARADANAPECTLKARMEDGERAHASIPRQASLCASECASESE